MHPVISAARTLADHINASDTGSSFDRAVDDFAGVLETVSHSGLIGFTAADRDALATLAERVIDRIEDRLETHRDRGSIRQDLAGAIYRIRRELEAIDLWVRYTQRTTGPILGRAS